MSLSKVSATKNCMSSNFCSTRMPLWKKSFKIRQSERLWTLICCSPNSKFNTVFLVKTSDHHVGTKLIDFRSSKSGLLTGCISVKQEKLFVVETDYATLILCNTFVFLTLFQKIFVTF